MIGGNVRTENALLGQRLAARLIDACLVGLAWIALWGFALMAMRGHPWPGSLGCRGGWPVILRLFIAGSALFLGAISPIVYDLVGTARWQKTAGKLLLGLRVTRIGGLDLRWSQCLIRAAAFWVSLPVPMVAIFDILTGPGRGDQWESLTLALSLTVAGVTAGFAIVQRRFVHDWLAGTRVVRSIPV